MPNMLGHMQVGHEVMQTTDPYVLLGTTVSDFLGMYRDLHGGRLCTSDFTAVPGLSEGMRLHQRTDTIFDALPLAKEVVHVGRTALTAISPMLQSGAVRGCARIAPDILLDGVLLQDPDVEDLYEQTRDALLAGPIFSQQLPHAMEFEGLIQDYFRQRVSYRYQDTERVAAILQHRFDHRPTELLKFNKSAIPVVAEALDIQRQRLQHVGAQLVSLTVQGLTALRLGEHIAA